MDGQCYGCFIGHYDANKIGVCVENGIRQCVNQTIGHYFIGIRIPCSLDFGLGAIQLVSDLLYKIALEYASKCASIIRNVLDIYSFLPNLFLFCFPGCRWVLRCPTGYSFCDVKSPLGLADATCSLTVCMPLTVCSSWTDPSTPTPHQIDLQENQSISPS